MIKQHLAGALVLALSGLAVSAAAGDFSGYVQARYRYEQNDNFNVRFYGEHPGRGDADDSFLLQRLRAVVTYNFSEKVLFSVGVQDSRVYGLGLPDDLFANSSLGRPHDPFEDYTEPYDTYVLLKKVFDTDFQIKAGRQVIRYGNNRIFGPGEWGNSGRYAWDAVVVSWKKEKDFVDLFWGAHIIHDPETVSWVHRQYYYGAGIYSHLEWSGALVTEPFLVFKYDTHDTFQGEFGGRGDFFSVFPGIRITGELPHDFFYDVTWVWQSGNYGPDDIQAWGAHGKLGRKFPELPFKPCPSVEYSYATGDGDPRDGVRERFEGVFGARDLMYGRMNLFDWSNLRDLQFNLDVEPVKTVHVRAEVHRFWLDQAKDGWSHNPRLYRDRTGTSGKHVGDEFDLVLTWKPDDLLPKGYKGLELQAGYSHFWPGGFTEKVADNCGANWYFAQVTYTLKF